MTKTTTMDDPGTFRRQTSKTRLPSDVDQANYLSRLYCLYAGSFLFRIWGKNVDLSCISECSQQDKCDALANALQINWNKESQLRKAGEKPYFIRAFLKTIASQFFIGCIPHFYIYGIGRPLSAVLLGKVIFYANQFAQEQAQETRTEIGTYYQGYDARDEVIFWSGLLSVIVLLNFLVSHPYFLYRSRNGMQWRVAITRLVYEKALKTSVNSIHGLGVGKVVNLIANDANRFETLSTYCECAFMSPFELAVGMYILYYYTGPACFGCLAILLIYIPFQCFMGNLLSRFRSKSIVLTDDRLRLMSELLPAMRVIKMYVWEKPFSALVHLSRRREIQKIRHAMILLSVNLSLYFACPKLMAFVVIILYLASGEALTAEVVFVTLSLVYQLRTLMTYFLPLGISSTVEAYISSKRIQDFLLEDEVEPVQECRGDVQVPSIQVNQISVFSALDRTPILYDISFDVQPGKLTAIIGPVGSGKSSILLSILKELPIRSGDVQTCGNVIYVSQEAWIFKGTVRDNILFGRPFDRLRYKDVVRVSALLEDIVGFEDGDLEKVDDRGTSLSGGQKARISLARALYADADCYLLDDPLSAVDASVAKHIFDKCIKKYLYNKCVLLVTHQLQFIKSADQILVMKEGSMLARGSFSELLSKGIDVFNYSAPQTYDQQFDDEQMPSFDCDNVSMDEIFIESDADSLYDKMSLMNTSIRSSVLGKEECPYSNGVKMGRLQLYWIYIRAGGGILLFTLFFCSNILTQVFFTGSDYWLSVWTEYKQNVQLANNNQSNVPLPALLASNDSDNKLIYSILVLLLFINSIVRTISFFIICTKASVNLHNSIFSSLITAPMVFFDKTPIGVIMNRVSRDLGIVDDLLPPTAFEAIDILTNALGVFVICAYANLYVLIPFVLLVVMIYGANKFYVQSARKIKRLEAIARSPIFSQMSSTISGLSTIRAYHAENMLLKSFSDTLDTHTSTLYTFISVGRLYGIFLEVLCVLYIYCLILILNIFLEDFPASIVGLAISQSLMLANAFNWGVRQYTEVETQMTSVERIVEFGNVEKENLDRCEELTRRTWPEKGQLTFEDVTLEYPYFNDQTEQQECRKVLKNISFKVAGGEKIGIVGRTGAGKSSLITALFRLTQPGGIIEIDGYDTSKISLAHLRSHISIISQEPVIFSGTVRRNLDLFGTSNDENLWKALTKAQLAQKVRELPKGLDSECGNDFSVGQRQLICLARAILRNNKILVLDEATANVDPITDGLIQSSIRKEFRNCTVLTIAHRLNTIIDYDRVLVLDQGEVLQFDTPYALIKKQSGIFYELFINLSTTTRRDLESKACEIELKRICKRLL